MDSKPMTLEQIKALRPTFDRAKVDATTEADIRRHMIEDGEDPDAPLPEFVLVRNGMNGPDKVMRTGSGDTETAVPGVGRSGLQ